MSSCISLRMDNNEAFLGTRRFGNLVLLSKVAFFLGKLFGKDLNCRCINEEGMTTG